MRQRRPRPLVTVITVAALATGVSFGAVQVASATPHSTATSVSAQPYSGQQLFEGLFFGLGPIGTAHPGLAQAHVASSQRAGVDRVVAQMNRSDPSFFAGFRRQIATGNFYAVQQALESGQAHFATALQSLGGRAAVKPGVTGDCVFVAIAAVAGGVWFVAAVKYKVKFWAPADNSDQLARDRWVANVSSSLRA